MLFAVIAGFIASSLLVILFLQGQRCRRLKRQIENLEQQSHEQPAPAETFSQDLVAAERSQAEPMVPKPQGLPARYRYITGMAQQGLNAAQIASVLQMGEVEVAQIVRLSLLKKDV